MISIATGAWRGVWLTMAGICLAAALAAEPLPPPTGRVLLTVSGTIEQRNTAVGAQFDRAMLAALPQQEVRTKTPWTAGESSFEGPLLQDVLARVGATGDTIEALALDAYRATLSRREIERYGVILALRRDGQPMSIRQRGPLWIIYPWSQMPELNRESIYDRAVWQLYSLTISP